MSVSKTRNISLKFARGGIQRSGVYIEPMSSMRSRTTASLYKLLSFIFQGRSHWCLLVAAVWCFTVLVTSYMYVLKQPLHCSPVTSGRNAFRERPRLTCPGGTDHTALSVLQKELVVRGVYFDPRRRNGYDNATVFLLEVRRSVKSASFSGCRVGPYRSDKFKFHVLANYKWVQERHRATEQLALLDCYKIPQITHGDSASLFYTSPLWSVEEVQSPKPLVVPEAKATNNMSATTAVVCLANVFLGKRSPTEYGMIYHWLRYQKTIGVDHVHMIVEDNFVRAGGFREAYSQQAIREGFLSIDFWPKWLDETEVFYHSQMLAYEDCLYRFQNTYEYIIYADYDDYFVPLKGNKSIKHYLQTWCAGENGTCRFQWYQFYPDCGWDPTSVRDDGNLTATVSYNKTTARNITKSAHQLRALLDAGVHRAEELMPGYVQQFIPPSEAYFAHLRRGSHPQGGC